MPGTGPLNPATVRLIEKLVEKRISKLGIKPVLKNPGRSIVATVAPDEQFNENQYNIIYDEVIVQTTAWSGSTGAWYIDFTLGYAAEDYYMLYINGNKYPSNHVAFSNNSDLVRVTVDATDQPNPGYTQNIELIQFKGMKP